MAAIQVNLNLVSNPDSHRVRVSSCPQEPLLAHHCRTCIKLNIIYQICSKFCIHAKLRFQPTISHAAPCRAGQFVTFEPPQCLSVKLFPVTAQTITLKMGGNTEFFKGGEGGRLSIAL